MIVDTSALMAIILNEPESDMMLRKILQASPCRISAATRMEAATVVIRRHPAKADLVEALFQRVQMAIEPVTSEQARLGADAYRKFGRGTGHPARLNFGDCFAYALAKATGEPLLYKGDDFAQTDILTA